MVYRKNLADLVKSSNLLVELPPEVNKEAINSSLSTTNNCSSDSGTNKTYTLFKTLQCKVFGLTYVK